MLASNGVIEGITFNGVVPSLEPRVSTIGRWSAVYYMVRVLLGVFVNVIKYEKRYHTGEKVDR